MGHWTAADPPTCFQTCEGFKYIEDIINSSAVFPICLTLLTFTGLNCAELQENLGAGKFQ